MPSEDVLRLKRNLKTARESVRVSQKAAGKAVLKSRQTIVNWEDATNTAEPSTAELAVLAKLYRVTPLALRFEELAAQPAAPVIHVEPRTYHEAPASKRRPKAS